MKVARSPSPTHPQAQRGVVLIIALIVLVAMTLAAMALVRSVDTNNLIAGNMAFQQAATHSSDLGMETATKWLFDNQTTTGVGGVPVLEVDDATNGYVAGGSDLVPDATKNPPQTWDDYWTKSLSARPPVTLAQDAAGNTVSYVIDRMCKNAGSKTGGASCVASPLVSSAGGNNEEAGDKQLNAPSLVFYRITVRVAGPRNTVSYVQSMISM